MSKAHPLSVENMAPTRHLCVSKGRAQHGGHRETRGSVPRQKQRCLRAFLGSKFCGGGGGGRRAINCLLPAPSPQESGGAKGQEKELGKVLGTPSARFPVHTPSQMHRVSASPPSQASSPFPSNPLPSRPFFSHQPSPRPALPDPIFPPSPPPRPFQHPPPSSSHPFPAPTSVGWGAWGAGPLPSQAAAAVVAGGCVSASVGVSVPRGATGFGGVLAPADGGEVRVGGWAHSGRNGGGLSPQLPPSLPSCRLGGLGLLLPLSPATPPHARSFPGLARK